MDDPIPQPSRHEPRLRTFTIFLVVGLALFVLSFWLPSVSQHSGGGSRSKGYQCAALAFLLILDTLKENFFMGICLLWADLANLLALVWLALQLTGARLRLRRMVAAAMLIGSLPCALAFILHNEMSPVWGYFAWVAGLAIMSAPDWRQPLPYPHEMVSGQPGASI